MVFGSGGHLRRPPAGVTRSYTDGLCLHHHVKSLVQPQWVLKPLSPHHFAYAEGRFSCYLFSHSLYCAASS